MKYIVIGGVAGGATAAARIRRNTEQAEIILFEGRIHFVCQLWSTLLYRRCDCGAGKIVCTDSGGFRETF